MELVYAQYFTKYSWQAVIIALLCFLPIITLLYENVKARRKVTAPHSLVSVYCGFIRKCVHVSDCECILGSSTGIQFTT